MDTVVVKGVIAKRLKERAEKLDPALEEYLLELLARDMDPKDRARKYAAAAFSLLEEARNELEKENKRQAAEKVWGAVLSPRCVYCFVWGWRVGVELELL